METVLVVSFTCQLDITWSQGSQAGKRVLMKNYQDQADLLSCLWDIVLIFD